MENKFIIENGVLKSANITDSTIIIPKDVTRIGAEAFKNGTFEAVSFAGNSIKSIDEDAFRECKRLQSIMIPDGIIQIGDHAFYGCSNLKYIGIPSSVIVIGDDVLGNCNSDLFIIGEEESEAAKIAKQYNFILKPNDNNTISAYNAAINAKKTNKTKTFDVFGEKVVCSNTLSTYYRTIEHYSNRKDDVFRLLSSRIPMTINEQFGDLLEVLQNEQNNTIQRLSSQGVFVRPSVLEPYILESYRSIYAALEAIKEAYDSIKSSVESGISNNNAALIREAESKVTGLSYGFLGGGFDMVAYSLDDYREKKRQRKAAYAEAERKSKEFSQQQILNGKLQYSSFIAQALPYLNQGTDMFVDALCKAEIDQLIHSGLIDSESARDVDIQKSNQLLNSITDDNADNSFTIALAIKKYPCNIAAFVYAKEHQYSCTGFIELMSFLHLTKKVDDIVCNNKNNRIEKLTEKVQSANSGNSGVEEIEKNLDWLSKEDIKHLLTILAKTISPMIERVFYPDSYENTSNLRLYCTKKLSNVIDNKSWDFFIKYSINPIPSELSSNEMIDYDVAIDLLCNKFEQIRKEEQEKKNELDYQKALIDYESNNLESIKNAKKMFEELSDYKDADLLVKKCNERIIELKKKSTIRTTIISTSLLLSIIIIVGVILLFNKVIIPNSKLNKAKELAKESRYSEAIGVLKDLTDSSEAQELISTYSVEEEKQVLAIAIEKARELAESGKYMEAAGELMNNGLNKATTGLFKDYIYKSKEIVTTGEDFTVAIKQDGTVLATGKNDSGQCDVSNWNNIISVSAGQKHTVGLKKDGTVIATGDNSSGQCEVTQWNNIIAISAGYDYTIGLTEDGSVVLAGCYENDIYTDSHGHIVFDKIRNQTRIDLPRWNDIVSISAGRDSFAGLTENMSVVCAGFNGFAQSDISNWKNIEKISSGYRHTVGLSKDGKVFATGENDNRQCDITEWDNIVSVSAGYDVTIGLMEDGTTIFSRPYQHYSSEQELSNIISISASRWSKFFVFVKSDGSVVAYGNNSDGQCNVSEWKLW